MSAVRMAILGRQGSGKGTQSLRIAEQFGCVHVSTGDVLRAAVAAGTALGQKAADTLESGGLVGDDIMNSIVGERLAEADIAENGVLLDGFPRTTAQADSLEQILNGLNHRLTIAVNLDVPVAEVTRRMMARGRSDDTEEAVARRLSLYEEQTAPLLGWFAERDLLITVDGLADEDEVFARLEKAIRSCL